MAAAAAKHLFSNIHHSHGVGYRRSSDHKKRGTRTPPEALEDPETYQRRKEEEKHSIAQWESTRSSASLSPSEITQAPGQKHVGTSTKHIRCDDFKLISTLGTGTFARVWLAKLAKPQNGDEDKVFALKILRKVDVIKLKQVEHVRNERKILSAVAGHPFITTMVASFQDADSLYMILDYCPGGEIFTYLRKTKKFEEQTAKFYAAEIVLILEFLHEQEDVAYRDLKPENILLDADGHLKLVDFGFAKKLSGRETWTLCGTPEYLAPETIKNSGHGTAVDWWALGILIFEFLAGQPPFWDHNPLKIYEQITDGHIKYSSCIPKEARDLIGKLCQVQPSKRLGNLSGHAADVKKHPWFKDINWENLYNRELEPPIKPSLCSNCDTQNFERYDSEGPRKGAYTPDLQKKYENLFASF